MADKTNTEWYSSDFPTLCCLFHLGINPDHFERNPYAPGKTTVYFKRTADLDETLKALRARSLTVEPMAFLDTTREVRGRLRDCA